MNQLVEIAVHNNPAPLPSFTFKVAPKSFADKVGTYRLASGAVFHVTTNEVTLAGGKRAKQLLISAEGQEAIDLLYSANELKDIMTLSNGLNQKTARFLELLANKNIDSLKTFFSEDSSKAALALWEKTESMYGKLKGYFILGTSPLNQMGSQTFIQLRFEKHTGVYKLTWRNEKLWNQAEDRLQPMVTSFVRKSNTMYPLTQPAMPVSNNEFVVYDFFKNQAVKISLIKRKMVFSRFCSIRRTV